MVEISISLSLHCTNLTLTNLFDEYQILVSHFSTNAIPQFLKLTIQATIRDRWEIHACLHKMTIMCMAKVICLLTINIYIGHNFLQIIAGKGESTNLSLPTTIQATIRDHLQIHACLHKITIINVHSQGHLSSGYKYKLDTISSKSQLVKENLITNLYLLRTSLATMFRQMISLVGSSTVPQE